MDRQKFYDIVFARLTCNLSSASAGVVASVLRFVLHRSGSHEVLQRVLRELVGTRTENSGPPLVLHQSEDKAEHGHPKDDSLLDLVVLLAQKVLGQNVGSESGIISCPEVSNASSALKSQQEMGPAKKRRKTTTSEEASSTAPKGDGSTEQESILKLGSLTEGTKSAVLNLLRPDMTVFRNT
ncbi:unnamed protein product, partial [Amoebophrya sp. A25]|eukprot:GSA25T00005869001.1